MQKLLNSKIHEYRMCGVLILVEQYKKVSLEILRNPRPPRKRERCGQVLTPAALPARLQAGGPAVAQDDIFSFYLKNIRNINNWDLVDLSAPNIVGDCLLNKNKNILYKLIKSKNLWERRIVVLACFAFIKNNNFSDAIKISKILLTDKHDLIHKAVGWMLREVGKRNEKILINFLNKYTLKMPRTMLRYAIEKLPEKKRKYYLNKK